jgi:hypothetical protein
VANLAGTAKMQALREVDELLELAVIHLLLLFHISAYFIAFISFYATYGQAYTSRLLQKSK